VSRQIVGELLLFVITFSLNLIEKTQMEGGDD